MAKKHKHYGYIVLWTLILLPVLLWLLGTDRKALFLSSGSVVGSLGKASAIAALAAYGLMPILSMRHKIVEKIFGGLDVVYKLHRNIGKVIFFLLLAHPLLLAEGEFLKGVPLSKIWGWPTLVVLSGLLGLAAFVLLAAIAVYAHMKHQRWIIVHKFFGFLLPLLVVHSLAANAQIVHNRALLVYMMTLVILGWLAFLYRSIYGSFLIKKFPYEVAEVKHVGANVTELVLKPIGIPISYTPGQFAYLSLFSNVIDTEAHPYSFATAPNGPYVRFAIKQLGDDTAKYGLVVPGTKAYLEGPYGKFSYLNSKNTTQVWIAGGVGITPFLSMARSFSRKNKYTIYLFYAADKLQDAVFLEELLVIRRTLPGTFNVTIVNRTISGFISAEMIEQEVTDILKPDYFICGPPIMMKSLKQALGHKGISSQKIYTEEFSVL